MSTKRKPAKKKVSRFQIKQTPEQSKAFKKLLAGANVVHNDGTKIGGDQLVRPRNKSTIFRMHFDGPESKDAYVEVMSRMNEIDEKDQPLLGGQR